MCNSCACRQDSDGGGGLYSGRTCEKAPGEIEPCLVLRDCVECLAFGSGPLAQGGNDEGAECPAHCLALEYSEVQRPNTTGTEAESSLPQACEFENEAGCRYRFTSILTPEGQVEVVLLLTDDGAKEVHRNMRRQSQTR